MYSEPRALIWKSSTLRQHGNGKSHPLSIFQATLDWGGRPDFPFHSAKPSEKKTAPAIRSVQHLGAGSAEDSLSYGALLAQETPNLW
jgi:hypothetical protein